MWNENNCSERKTLNKNDKKADFGPISKNAFN